MGLFDRLTHYDNIQFTSFWIAVRLTSFQSTSK